MANELTNKDLMRFLKTKHLHAGFLSSLKLHYRPLICPYVDLINRVQPGARVGDIGCGSGQFLLLLSAFAKPSYLYGIEINDQLIKNGKELLSGFDAGRLLLATYDGTNFPALLGEMDILFLIDVLHHVPKSKQEGFLINLVGAMKSGASLVIKDIDAANPLVICNKLHDLIVSTEIGHELSTNKVCSILANTPLEIKAIQKITTYVYPHYTIVGKKP